MPAPLILAILNRVETAPAVLRAANTMARVYPGAAVDLLHPRPDTDPDFMPTEEIMSLERQAEFEAAQEALTARLVTLATEADGMPVPREVRGTVRETVAKQAAQAALVVAGAPGDGGRSPARDAVEAALLDARAPLLLLPERVVGVLTGTVAVAWERSRAADEAVEAALPILLAAQRVVVLVADEGHARADLPRGLMEAVRRSGPEPAVCRFGLGDRDIGDAILAEAASEHADLLVMGAFSRPRVLETVFGGATQQILKGAHIPLLLHH